MSAPATLVAPPDRAAVEERQPAIWARSDYPLIGSQIVAVSELLIEALDLHSTEVGVWQTYDRHGTVVRETPFS